MQLDPNPRPKDTRMTAIVVGVAAAALLIFAAVSKTWLARPGMYELGFGPLGCSKCGVVVGEDGGMSNGAFITALRDLGDDAAKTASSAFAPMGWATFGLCAVAALALLAAAGLALARKRPDLPVAPTSVALLALMGALITGMVFVATKPGGPGFVGVSLGFWAFSAGAVGGILSAQMLAKLLRPVDPDLLDGAMNPEQY